MLLSKIAHLLRYQHTFAGSCGLSKQLGFGFFVQFCMQLDVQIQDDNATSARRRLLDSTAGKQLLLAKDNVAKKL